MKKWWKETVFYEIYVPSFKDGNGDGIGDFSGITQKLDYLAELGVGAIWLTPFYRSPRIDNGYDISDYLEIDPLYGDNEDFEFFLTKAHSKGIKVIVDLVINHTSTEHEWFKDSASSLESPKRDWYIWQSKPNNWESFFGGSAWEHDAATDQYYYHSFAREQADLNWSNPEVKQALFAVIDYWIKRGIDGFRLDVINNLTVNRNLDENPVDEKIQQQIHQFDKDQAGIVETLKEIVDFIKSKNSELFTVGEISSDDAEWIGKYSKAGLLDVTFNFNLGSVEELDVGHLFNELEKMEQLYAPEQYPTLFFGSHDMARVWSRLAEGKIEMAEMLAALMLTAKGVPFIYFGEEIGMEDLIFRQAEDLRDIQGIIGYRMALAAGQTEEVALEKAGQLSRDKARAPMQWGNEPFSDTVSWIPHAPEAGKHRERLFAFYQKLITLRRSECLSYAKYDCLELINNLIYYQRGSYLIFLNADPKDETIKNDWDIESIELANQSAVSWNNTEISIPAYSTTIFKLR